MKRRKAIELVPLTLAGMSGIAVAQEHLHRHRPEEKGQEHYPRGKGAPPHPPMGKPPLSIQYTKKVRGMLQWIRDTQSENLLEASYAIAQTVKNGGQCWVDWDMGHNNKFDLFPCRNGNPEIFTPGFNANAARKGDLFLVSRYMKPEELIEKGIFIVGGPCPWGMDARMDHLIVRDSAKYRLRPYAHIWIENNITTLGAIMKIPGMPAPIGPVSGILGMTTFWMMQADACRILARDGISVKVQGDESPLSGKSVPWVNLHNPLMDDYFERVMMEIEMIGAELGNIRKIAKMALDSVLSGGKVYVYSRYRNSLSVEGQTRRGGLVMTRGIHESDGKLITHGGTFEGTSKDTVIMGIWKPDDEVDLKHLDLFRKLKMKVASMGPMTRDIKIPSGRTVPKETDVHVGRMCDTNGLYAVPGFEQKVCPTSGPLINQMFWATCMEIVEETIRRTGNVPGVFFSAAVKDGTEHMHLMNQWYQERGY